MRTMCFKNIGALSEFMADQCEDGKYVAAFLFYDDAIALLKEFMFGYDYDINSIEMSISDYDGYDKEYCISLTDFGGLDVEPAYRNGGYIFAGADIVLIHGDASSAILKTLDEIRCIEFYIEQDFDVDDECCCCCDCSDCKDLDEDEKFEKILKEELSCLTELGCRDLFITINNFFD